MSRQRRSVAVFIFFVIVSLTQVTYAAEYGYDFIKEAKLIYTVVACGDGQIPLDMDSTAVQLHRREIIGKIENVRKNFVNVARPFISALLPDGLPKTVVYSFGGGDLLTAMATYPYASDITTISLESAGDPQRLSKAGKKEFTDALTEFRKMAVHLLDNHDSKNANLRMFDRGIIPGQLAFSLAAANVYGYEPVSLKYFRIESDGKLYYYNQADIESLKNVKGKKLAKFWIDTDFSVAFRNMELELRKIDKAVAGPEVIIHRHIAANLDNKDFTNSSLKKYLEEKGKISAMTKAGSYLLWMDDFSAFRNYLLGNMAFMISDSTGILPRHAVAAGFEQVTYGRFYGAFLDNNGGDDAVALCNLFKSQPYRELPFRYGYSDIKAANHLIVTKPKFFNKPEK